LVFRETLRERSPFRTKREITIGIVIVAGATVLEAALMPGSILGGVAAWLAPRPLSGRRSKASRQDVKRISLEMTPQSSREVAVRQPSEWLAKCNLGGRSRKPSRFASWLRCWISRRTTSSRRACDHGGPVDLLIAGPLFYFTHEAVRNHLGPADGNTGVSVQLPTSTPGDDTTALTINRPLPRRSSTFTTAAEATILSATGFFLGPFVYCGIWLAIPQRKRPRLTKLPCFQHRTSYFRLQPMSSR